jgi:hypothetical protein
MSVVCWRQQASPYVSYFCPIDGSHIKPSHDLEAGRKEDGGVLVLLECETCRRAARPPLFKMRRSQDGEIVPVSHPV